MESEEFYNIYRHEGGLSSLTSKIAEFQLQLLIE